MENFFSVFDDEFFEILNRHESTLKDVNVSGPTAVFWFSFIEMINILFAFLRSVKLGIWDLHMKATHKMLPWFFAYDRPNYSRFLTLYWADMMQLPETHEEIHKQFM